MGWEPAGVTPGLSVSVDPSPNSRAAGPGAQAPEWSLSPFPWPHRSSLGRLSTLPALCRLGVNAVPSVRKLPAACVRPLRGVSQGPGGDPVFCSFVGVRFCFCLGSTHGAGRGELPRVSSGGLSVVSCSSLVSEGPSPCWVCGSVRARVDAPGHGGSWETAANQPAEPRPGSPPPRGCGCAHSGTGAGTGLAKASGHREPRGEGAGRVEPTTLPGGVGYGPH